MTIAHAITIAHATDWPQFGFDARHSGNNFAEVAIDRDHVAFLRLEYFIPVLAPSISDSAPVYASAVETPAGTKDLLFFNASDGLFDFVCTTGLLIAIDAADGSIVWVQTTSGSNSHASSSPAVDPGREFVYAYGLDGYVHKYRIGDGLEVITPGPVGWPALVTLKPATEKVAGGLTVVETSDSQYLVAVTDAYAGDGGDYQGHVTSIDLSSGAEFVFNAICSDVASHLANGACADVGGGIWGRGGATFDAVTHRLYVATGNGHFDANAGGHNWGDTVLALPPNGSSNAGMPIDSYTPWDYQDLDTGDLDLGLTSPAILPAPPGSNIAHLGLQIGKSGIGYLINLDDMSGTGQPAGVGGELQEINTGGGATYQPAIWTDPDDGSTWLFVDGSAWQIVLDASGVPSLQWRWNSIFGGSTAVIANDILYWSPNMVAEDPRTGDPLWLSGDGSSVHWQTPIVVDGAIFLTDNEGNLLRWSLPTTHVVTPVVADPEGGNIDPSEPQIVVEGNVARFMVSPAPGYSIGQVSGCEAYFDGEFYVTEPVLADCTVLATFVLDAIFNDGFDASP